MARRPNALKDDQSRRTLHTRIAEAVRGARTILADQRRTRTKIIRSFVGTHYSENAAEDKMPINLLELAQRVYRQHLASHAPKTSVSTWEPRLRAVSKDLQVALDALLEDILFGDTLGSAVDEAMFALAVAKTGIAPAGPVDILGEEHEAGRPFCGIVGQDDLVYDAFQKRWEQCRFIGDRYVMPLENAKELFDGSSLLTARRLSGHTDDGTELAAAISRGSRNSGDDEYMPMAECWDLWFPYEGLMRTYAADDEGLPHGDPLREFEWTTPEDGPYITLSYGSVPDSIAPLSPLSLMYDLHELANAIFRKLGRQVERQKTILGVMGGSEADGRQITNASDGEGVTLNDPQRTQEYRFGGIDPPSLAFLLQVKDLYAYVGGNIDAIGGLSPQAETLGQERLLREGASARLLDLQKRTETFARKCVQSLAAQMWEDPLWQPEVQRLVPGTQIAVSTTLSSEERGPFPKYDLDIVPYSMRGRSPADMLGAMLGLLERVVYPLMPALQQQGLQLNAPALIEEVARLADVPQLLEIVTAVDPMIAAQGENQGKPSSQEAGVETPQGGGEQKETYRRTIPGASRGGKDDVLTRILMGAGVQNSEASAMRRPTG